MPEINDPQEYGDRWNAWWWSMQPSWREPDSPFNMPSEASAGSWSHLLCGGPNGLLLVILALAWWMKSSTKTNRSSIEEAAIDITWVLAQLRLGLNVSGDKGKKRELETEPDNSSDLPSSKRYLILSQYQIEDKD
jgi:hypothetical protein